MSCRTYEAKLKMFRNHMHQYINDLRKTLVLPHSLEVLGVSLQTLQRYIPDDHFDLYT